MARLTGKTALISGAAMGIGAAVAAAIVANGGQVAIGDIAEEPGRELARRLGDAALFLRLDVTRPDDWLWAVAETRRHFGQLNVLVNNAGVVHISSLAATTDEDWATDLAVNLSGTFYGIRAAAGALVADAPSSIVNISSVDGLVGGPQHYGYVAAKYGVRGLTKAVAGELSPQGVRVNSIHPGVIATPFTQRLGANRETPFGLIGRMGRPEDIAHLVVFLASDESAYSTGSEFVADGGQILQIPAPPGVH